MSQWGARMNEPAKRSRLTTVLLAGVAVLAVALLVLAIGVALNWRKVESLVDSATSTFSELNDVRAAVAAQCKAEQITVGFKRAKDATILSVQIINAPQVQGLSNEQLKNQARELAATARDALSSSEEYQRYEVVFVQRRGAGITLTSSSRFVFRADDLPGKQPAEKE